MPVSKPGKMPFKPGPFGRPVALERSAHHVVDGDPFGQRHEHLGFPVH